LRSTTIVARLTEHDDVIKSLLKGTPRLGLALGPASARAGPVHDGNGIGKIDFTIFIIFIIYILSTVFNIKCLAIKKRFVLKGIQTPVL